MIARQFLQQLFTECWGWGPLLKQPEVSDLSCIYLSLLSVHVQATCKHTRTTSESTAHMFDKQILLSRKRDVCNKALWEVI